MTMYSGDEYYGDEITSPLNRPAQPRKKATMDPQETLQTLAEQRAAECFTQEYVRTAPQETREEEGLGIALACWARWDGLKLMRVFFAALEDANVHGEAAQVQEMIEHIERS